MMLPRATALHNKTFLFEFISFFKRRYKSDQGVPFTARVDGDIRSHLREVVRNRKAAQEERQRKNPSAKTNDLESAKVWSCSSLGDAFYKSWPLKMEDSDLLIFSRNGAGSVEDAASLSKTVHVERYICMQRLYASCLHAIGILFSFENHFIIIK